MSLTRRLLHYSENYDSLEPLYGTHHQEAYTSRFSNLKDFKIDEVKKVKRRFLAAAFALRKKEYQIRGLGTHTSVMFHHTCPSNVLSILKTNLNWRKVSRHRYGKGVSFTEYPEYGHRHSNGHLGVQAVIVAEILIGRTSMIAQDGYTVYSRLSVSGLSGLRIIRA